MAVEGRSAGGLLVGAAINRAPDVFCAAVGAVPFLDAAGTLQDATLPLTANEWEEFGNPNEAKGLESVMGFSPVHNVRQGVRYPRMLLLPALNDARTGFWEALKFAHAIRTNGYNAEWQGVEGSDESACAGSEATGSKTTGSSQAVYVSMDLEGGHFRSADPVERAKQRGKELGFLLAALRHRILRGPAL